MKPFWANNPWKCLFLASIGTCMPPMRTGEKVSRKKNEKKHRSTHLLLPALQVNLHHGVLCLSIYLFSKECTLTFNAPHRCLQSTPKSSLWSILRLLTKQGSRASCFNQIDVAAFGKEVQLISGPRYSETCSKTPNYLALWMGILIRSRRINKPNLIRYEGPNRMSGPFLIINYYHLRSSVIL